MLAEALSQYWWATLFRGALWILFGIVAVTQPITSLVALALLFGAFAVADGAARIVAAMGGLTTRESSWMLALSGIAGMMVGLFALFTPQLSSMVLLVCIAIWAIVTGLLEIAIAFRLRKVMEGEFWLGLGGLVSVLFGTFLLARPAAGAFALMWLIGVYAIALGLILIVAAIEARWLVRRRTT
jgi:uncharacterized membrane protein HdeD (DUF308 family)